jgi:hypothetical protein
MPWYRVWIDVVTHPSRDTFRRILADPTAGQKRAFTWMAVMGLVWGIMFGIFFQAGGGLPYGNLPTLSTGLWILCLVILFPIFSVIGLALSTAIFHGIAKLLGGAGTFDALVYCIAAISAPMSIVTVPVSLLQTALSRGGSASSIAPLCVVPFSLALGIYSIVLEVLAIDSVERIGTGKAVLTVLIPVIIAFAIGVCFVLVVGIAAYQQFLR